MITTKVVKQEDGYFDVMYGHDIPDQMTYWNLAGYTTDETVANEAAQLIETSEAKDPRAFEMLEYDEE